MKVLRTRRTKLDERELERNLRERDAAFLSLDETTIKKYLEKAKIPYPKNDRVFWIFVHKFVYHIAPTTDEQKEKSKRYLLEHDSNLGLWCDEWTEESEREGAE